MAGSKRIFNYTADNGVVYAVSLDESNTEAVNGAVANVPALAARSLIRRSVGLRLRRFAYVNAGSTRVLYAVALTPAIYAAAPPATIPDPLGAAGATLNFDRRIPERYPGIRWADSGLNDGDAES
jgi:hypothetical protein